MDLTNDVRLQNEVISLYLIDLKLKQFKTDLTEDEHNKIRKIIWVLRKKKKFKNSWNINSFASLKALNLISDIIIIIIITEEHRENCCES